MASHFIQPIEIDGVKYCPYELVLTSLYIEDTNTAVLGGEFPLLINIPASQLSGVGEFSKGITCEDLFTFTVEAFDFSTLPDFTISLEVYLNGVLYSTIDPGYFYEGSVPLTDSPCGNVITLAATVTRGSGDASDGQFYLRATA